MQSGSRKRAAPGSVPASMQSPQPQLQSPSQDFNNMAAFTDLSDMPDDEFLNWGGPRISEADEGNDDLDNGANSQNQLVRRNRNNQLAPRPGYGNQTTQAWPDSTSQALWPAVEDDEELERKAAEAQREALTKRPPKTIPPFIQKLSSYLDTPKYSDHIRWTEDGNSFLVLDEDEFAKQLLPELYKHNNFASFVRQLNMYGFHKKVGLSDNSMRASEKKSKSPSEYSNPYFKRGRPELLWLISKPKSEPSKSKAKKGKSADPDQDGEPAPGSSTDGARASITQSPNQDMVTMAKSQFLQFQRELQDIKRQQQTINQLISHFQHENTRFIQQASAQHERHENSINAILTFLATFYSRSVDGNGSFQNLFNSTIPDKQRPQGNVMDMGDGEDGQINSHNQLVRQRRPLALLPPPTNLDETSRITPLSATQSPRRSPRSDVRPASARRSVDSNTQTPISPPVKDQSSTPDFLGNISEKNDGAGRVAAPSNSDMMAAINNANANSSDQTFDFNSALRHFENANGNTPLTPEQRDNMLSLMANNAGGSGPNNVLSSLRNSSDNNLDYLGQFNNNTEHLEHLQRLQREQDARMQSIADRLQPLSPGGIIPGFSPGNSPNAYNEGSDLDFGKFINSDFEPSFFPDSAGVDGEDFKDFGYDEGAQLNDDGNDLFGPVDTPSKTPIGDDTGNERGKVLGSVANSSGAPSPADENTADDGGQRGSRKRQRTSKRS